MHYGLIGYPLTVSFSKRYFTEKFSQNEEFANFSYDLFPLPDIADLPHFLRAHADLQGLNVTIPHKKTVIPFLDELDVSAKEVGAVNVIKINKIQGSDKPKLIGYNSDVFGFEQSFAPLLKPHHRSALILGTGGSSAAVAFVLRKLHLPFKFVSRLKNGDNTLDYNDLHTNGFGDATILINTTPLGMSPNINTLPDLPYDQITPDFLCYDLVYTPDETRFLQRCKSRGANICNGLKMLRLQAEKAFEIWGQT